MKAVIMAGGFGTRLGPVARVVPKVLLPIGDRSVLETQLLRLGHLGFDDVYVTTYHRADFLEALVGDGSRYGVRVTYSREPCPLGTCGPLRLLSGSLGEPFVVINGDVLCTLDLAALHRWASTQDAWLTTATAEWTIPLRFGVVIGQGDRVVGVQEKPSLRVEVLAGIYVMKPEALSLIPEGVPFGMNELIDAMLQRELRIARYPMDCEWIDVGQPDDYGRAEHFYARHLKQEEAS